ncbi:MAG: hypothetical protein EOO92_12600, partial [Pedobacter sp.]
MATKINAFLISTLLLGIINCYAQETLINYSAGLPATDALGRKLPGHKEVGDLKKDRFIGIFYWTWHYHQAANKPNNTTSFLQKYPDALYNYE